MRARSNRDDRPIYLVAAAGIPNYGDEFITRSWLDWLADRLPDTEVWLDVIEPGRASHLFADSHPKLRITNTLWQLAHIEPHHDTERDAARVQDRTLNLGSPRVDLGLIDLRRMRSVHFLGGGYLNTIWPLNLSLLAAAAQLKKSFGVPLFATGQGFFPQDDSTMPFVLEQLAHFDFVESRDRSGVEKLGASPGLDDAFLAFRNSRPLYDTNPSPDLMVLVQNDFGESANEGLLIAVAAMIDRLSMDGTVGLVEGLPPDDSWAIPMLSERLPSTEFYPFARLWQNGFPARPGQTWVTTRFHFHLLAAAAGADGMAVDLGGGYYNVKHRLLGELGTGWPTVPAIPASFSDASAPSADSAFPSRVRRFAKAKEGVAQRIYRR